MGSGFGFLAVWVYFWFRPVDCGPLASCSSLLQPFTVVGLLVLAGGIGFTGGGAMAYRRLAPIR